MWRAVPDHMLDFKPHEKTNPLRLSGNLAPKPPSSRLEAIVRQGEEDNEPHCLVERVRRVTSGEVQLHFHRVVARR